MDKKENEIDKIFSDAKDFLPILGIDYIEFYVGMLSSQLIFINRLWVLSLKHIQDWKLEIMNRFPML